MFRREGIQALILIAVLAVLPLVFRGGYFWHLLTMFCIFGILAYSLNISHGYGGQLPFGWAAFWGLGAYASALLALRLNWPFFLTALLAFCIAGIAALIIGLISFRLKGLYFGLVNMCFGLVAYMVCLNWVSFTRGPLALYDIPLPSLNLPYFPKLTFGYGLPFYYLVAAGLVIVFLISNRIVNSRIGRAIESTRDNPELSKSLGINVLKYNMLAFCIGAAMAGFAGMFYAYYFLTIDPEMFSMHYTVVAFAMVIIGGKGTMYGPLLGALFYISAPEALRAVGEVRMIIFGFAVVLFVLYLPGGIWPVIIRGVHGCRCLGLNFRSGSNE